jgi:hypothetical protein
LIRKNTGETFLAARAWGTRHKGRRAGEGKRRVEDELSVNAEQVAEKHMKPTAAEWCGHDRGMVGCN